MSCFSEAALLWLAETPCDCVLASVAPRVRAYPTDYSVVRAVCSTYSVKRLVDCIAVVGEGNDLKDNLRVAVVKDLEAACAISG